ncbi:molybdopterin-dependent oxidoreductase [Haloechinothrix halophila]|uniref:molybdopterin-dependent oxidoreductase n=1 Tax=Haloechinothrix halophila TaxID=1069073 RepID=UPI00042629D4|nr:molybdopterin-dependent oxidoreductase [Haloechinothrix halophila]
MQGMNINDRKRGTRRGGRILIGAIVGIIAAGCGLAIGELAAAGTGPATSPVLSVGSAAIDLAPTPVKEFAIRTFGTADKLVLISGVLAALVILSAFGGVLARTRFGIGAVIFLVFGVLGVLAALTRASSELTDGIPSALAGLTALGVLYLLVRVWRRGEEPAPAATDAAPDPAPDADPASGTAAPVETDETSSVKPSRRGLLIASVASVAGAAVAATAGRLLQAVRQDVAESRAAIRLPTPADPAPELPAGYRTKVPGISPYFTPNKDFYRVDTVLSLPSIPAEEWTLRIGGDVTRPIELTYAELLDRGLTERDLTLSCVSNQVGGPYVGTARWLGVPLGDLLRDAGVSSSSDQLLSRSEDGMTIGTPMEAVLDSRDALLAVGMNGEPLPINHGFPARMIVPGFYGYTSATKWVVELTATRFDQVQAYWTQRDWDPRGVVKTASRVDVPRPFERVSQGEVTVAGVAWAQHRGISAVQVRMDGGPWQDAELSEQVSADTWRQWRTTFSARPGTRRFEVRAADGNGDLQTPNRTPPFPDGASGWHSVAVTVTP